ncbi:ribbon-helix-helix protein, CopG family [Aeromonas veronii]|jgi:hypothetical protein
MSIVPKPAQKAAAADAFIAGAPDATKRVRKGRKVQITLTITEQLLARVDELADSLGQSRAGTINLAVVQMLESGVQIKKTPE